MSKPNIELYVEWRVILFEAIDIATKETDTVKAEAMWRRANEIFKQVRSLRYELGIQEGIDSQGAFSAKDPE